MGNDPYSTSHLATISTVRSPVMELKIWVSYHLKVGINLMVLFFDDPEDPAIDQLPESDRLIKIICDESYWAHSGAPRPDTVFDRQKINIKNSIPILKSRSIDWMLFLDTDELIHSETDIHQFLAATSDEVIKLNMMEAIPNSLYPENIFEPRQFKVMPSKIHKYLIQFLGMKDMLIGGHYFRGHIQSKMFVKVGVDLSTLTAHGIRDKRNVRFSQVKNIYLLHFDCIGLDNWKQKWMRRVDGTGKSIRMRENRQIQMKLFEDALEKGEQALINAYKSVYFIPQKVYRRLSVLALVKTLQLPILDRHTQSK